MRGLRGVCFRFCYAAKESTAAVLLLLILGDVVAVLRYRRDCDWALLRQLLPSVLPGIALGAWFLSLVPDGVLRLSIGWLLVVFVVVAIVGRLRTPKEVPEEPSRPHWGVAVGTGVAAGFTTMTANAAGPVMTLYLLEAGVKKAAFIGTGAWFFLLVNVAKTPFSAALGLFPTSTLILTVFLAPFVLLGTWVGIRIVHRVGQRAFENLALVASLVGAVLLIAR
ncbi:MAG: sulfite exporter TauE/SafE family protein [Propionibacteriaceae bacterium]